MIERQLSPLASCRCASLKNVRILHPQPEQPVFSENRARALQNPSHKQNFITAFDG
jgi:hypothetical protein